MNILIKIDISGILGYTGMAICGITAIYFAWYHLVKYPNGKPKTKKL
jgi:hypothetical protein